MVGIGCENVSEVGENESGIKCWELEPSDWPDWSLADPFSNPLFSFTTLVTGMAEAFLFFTLEEEEEEEGGGGEEEEEEGEEEDEEEEMNWPLWLNW